ncbi:MAG: DNA repair protein RecO [Candidatus Shapirobacteria bacterium]|jgi:DNA repair protein RecO (recombination protein O)
MNRYSNTQGLVINKKSINEADILITLLTPAKGKITALAKGVKNIKSSRIGSLQLGNLIKVNLYAKDNFNWISEAQTITQFLRTKKNLTQVNLLFYFLEIINTLIAENQHIPQVFDISKNIIESINKNQVSQYIENEIKLLRILGFGVTTEIEKSYLAKDYRTTQKYVKQYFESIIEKPLKSNELFR